MNRRLAVIRCALLGVVVVCVAAGVLAGGGAAALADSTTAWWNLNTVVVPAQLAPEKTGQVIVTAVNVGDGEANGAASPITIADRLPAGVVPIAISGGLGPSQSYGSGTCSLVTVSCRFEAGVQSFFSLQIAITVRVEPGARSGTDEASIEGGDAPRVTARRPLAVDGSPSAFGVESYELVPEDIGGYPDVQAGSHPFQLTTTLNLNMTERAGVREEGIREHAIAYAKDLRFSLPAGLVGDPSAIPQCTAQQFSTETGFDGNACPLDTVIGVANTTLLVDQVAKHPATFPVPVFNLVPQRGEPARFGFDVLKTPVTLDVSVRTGSDYGVNVTVSNISQSAEFVGSKVTLWGVPADPRHDSARGWNCLFFGFFGTGPCEPLGATSTPPFITLPTSCGVWSSSLTADSWEAPRVETPPVEYGLQDVFGRQLGMGGCNRLGFEPSIVVTPDGQEGSTPTGLTVDVHVPQDAALNPTGDEQATVKDTTVALPAGVGLNPAGADGLSACGLGEIALESPFEQSCPESAKVGTVELRTPLLPNPLTGAAYLARQDQNPFGSLIALYIVAHDPVSGVIVKLAGEVKPDPASGQLVSTFKNTPQLPFEDLILHFFGGSRAPLGTPALCGAYTTKASFAPWSGNAAVESSSTFQITSGPNHTQCSDPLPFHPTLEAGSTNIQTGGYTQLTTTLGREDGEQNLQAIQLRLPAGLIGSLSQVQLCGEPQADAGTCGPESEIGETAVSVGLGGNPFTVTGGKVFITGPYGGAPFGLSIVNPAKAGPFDLGKVVVRAKVEVNPVTAALTVTTDPSGPYAIPHILDGIPLQIKHVNVLINRSRFVFNPSNCTPTAITATLSSSEGASSNVSVPFQVTNCATLKFKPKFAVSTPGKTSRTNGTSLSVKLTYPVEEGQANIAKVKVELPKQLPSRLPTLQKACTEAQFASNPEGCPATSRVGEAVATTPTISGVFTGPAYFVSHGGAAWPELIVVLKGEDGVTVDLHGETFINKQGVTSSTFNAVPDVPVGSFELKLPAGPYSALTANGANLCASRLAMPTEFVAQNGVVIHQSTKIAVTGCPKAKKASHRKKKGNKKRGRHSHAGGRRGKRRG